MFRHLLHEFAIEQIGAVLPMRPSMPRALSQRLKTRSNMAPPRSTGMTPAIRQRSRMRIRPGKQLKADLEKRISAEVALRLKSLHQLFKRKIRCARASSSTFLMRTRNSRKLGRPRRSARSTSAFTKNPIRPSSSGRLLPATGNRPRYPPARIAVQQSAEGGEQGHVHGDRLPLVECMQPRGNSG